MAATVGAKVQRLHLPCSPQAPGLARTQEARTNPALTREAHTHLGDTHLKLNGHRPHSVGHKESKQDTRTSSYFQGSSQPP